MFHEIKSLEVTEIVITILSQSKLMFVNRAVSKDQGSGFFPG